MYDKLDNPFIDKDFSNVKVVFPQLYFPGDKSYFMCRDHIIMIPVFDYDIPDQQAFCQWQAKTAYVDLSPCLPGKVIGSHPDSEGLKWRHPDNKYNGGDKGENSHQDIQDYFRCLFYGIFVFKL